MAATEIYTNNATTTVTNGGTTATSGSQTWTVASSATFPAAATGSTQFHVGDPAAPSELIAVTNVSSNTWTVTRGAESTTPVAHAQGFTVASVITAGGLNGLLSGASGPLAVTSGGTGGTAVTAYAVVTGGTSASTALQTVSGLGSSGQVLTSQGAGALPQWSAIGTAASVSGTVAILNGGTGQGSANAGFNALSPMTTLGDTIYGGASGAGTRLAGGTTATKMFYTQTGTGNASAAPAWGTIASADMPAGTTSAQGALQLDGTAANIQPVSTSASAGGNGKAADSGHVHAVGLYASPWLPNDAGLPPYLAWTFPTQICSAASQISNSTLLMRVNVRQQVSVSNVSIAISGATGGGLTTNQNFLGLYAGQTVGTFTAGTRVAISADQTSAFQTSGIITAALVGGPYTLPAAFYWVAILSNGGTLPSLARAPAITNAITNYGMTAANSAAASTSGGTILPLSFTPSALSQNNNYYWAAIS